MAVNEPGEGVSDWGALAQAVEQFKRAWQSGGKPSIDEYLAVAESLRAPLLLRLVRLDLEYRIEAGEAARVEEYLSRFPELAEDSEDRLDADDRLLELIAAEYRARLRSGGHASPEEYRRRFPQYESALHELLTEGSQTPPELAPAVPALTQPQQVPTVAPFAGFEILELLGRGGMGTVYLARDQRLGRVVVLKTTVPYQGAPRSVQDSFLQGARAAAALQHPGICPVLQMGEAGGRPYVISPYIEGRPLANAIREGPLPVPDAIAVAVQLARAMEHAHGRGVLHRDLKPSNVLMDAQGKPVILGFSLARQVSPAHPQLSTEGEVAGTPAYMAPEQWQGRTIGPAADIYALGVVLYEMLTGRWPLSPGGPITQIMEQALHGRPDPPSLLRPGLDPRLDAVCLKALAKDPAARYASMGEFAAALEACSSGRRESTSPRRGGLAAVAKAVLGWLAKPFRARRAVPPPDAEEVRSVDASFPASPQTGRLYNLHVRILAPGEVPVTAGRQAPSEPHPWSVPASRDVPPSARGAAPFATVAVSVAADNFKIEGATRAAITVPAGAASVVHHFRLRAERVGPGRIMIDFAQSGRPAGSLDLFPTVAPTGHRETGEKAPGNPDGGEVRLAPSPPPAPDIVLKVFEHRYAGSPGRLQFVLSSARPDLQDLPVWDGEMGILELKSDLATWVEKQLEPLFSLGERPDAPAEEVGKALRDIGCNLFEQVVPRPLQDLYWTLRERGVRTVLVLSDDPHIPWELIRPYRANATSGDIEAEDVFWGEAFALARWLRGRPPSQRLSSRRVCALAVGGGDVEPESASRPRDLVLAKAAGRPPAAAAGLPSAREELAILKRLMAAGDFRVLPARRQHLRDVFEAGEFDLLHLACHGSFAGTAAADGSGVLLEDGPFTAAELSPRIGGAMRRASPLIFFNACHTGRLGFSLTRLGSWGARLAQLGCGGFVGTLWPVSDRAALAFARAFYELLCAGAVIGEAVAGARDRVRKQYANDPTWLAYCCFADPVARLDGAAPRA